MRNGLSERGGKKREQRKLGTGSAVQCPLTQRVRRERRERSPTLEQRRTYVSSRRYAPEFARNNLKSSRIAPRRCRSSLSLCVCARVRPVRCADISIARLKRAVRALSLLLYECARGLATVFYNYIRARWSTKPTEKSGIPIGNDSRQRDFYNFPFIDSRKAVTLINQKLTFEDLYRANSMCIE